MAVHEHTFDLTIPLPADRRRVFEALTSAPALETWFAEHAEVEPREGGAYRFWGRHTLGTPTEAAADQRITRFEPGVALAFSWRLLDRDSEVTLTLRDDESEEGAGDGPRTRLRVEHRLESLPEMGRAVELIDDLWRIHTGSLLHYIMDVDPIYRPDYSDPDPQVRCEMEIDAPPATVFRVLIEPELISKWFPAPAPAVDPRVGGKYGFGFSFELDGKKVEPPPCTILQYEQDKKLAITWPDWRGDSSVPDQKVTWELEDLGGRTRLVLRHNGFMRPVDVSDYPFGWGHFLEEIRNTVDSISI